jgi:hypothetical protein
MADEDKRRREEWLAQEQERLRRGFSYQPPSASAGSAGAGSGGDQALAGLGLGAGVVGGAVAPHPNPVTFEGVPAVVIAEALRAELTDHDTRLAASPAADSLVVTIYQARDRQALRFQPALAVTMVERGETLTVTVSELAQGAVTDVLGSIGGTLLEEGWDIVARRRAGLGGLLSTVGHIVRGAGRLADTLEDLTLPKRTWAVIDRVGAAAEDAYREARRRAEAAERAREAALRAWTHCPYCGRAYEAAEEALTNCPACGGPRGARPDGG